MFYNNILSRYNIYIYYFVLFCDWTNVLLYLIYVLVIMTHMYVYLIHIHRHTPKVRTSFPRSFIMFVMLLYLYRNTVYTNHVLSYTKQYTDLNCFLSLGGIQVFFYTILIIVQKTTFVYSRFRFRSQRLNGRVIIFNLYSFIEHFYVLF